MPFCQGDASTVLPSYVDCAARINTPEIVLKYVVTRTLVLCFVYTVNEYVARLVTFVAIDVVWANILRQVARR